MRKAVNDVGQKASGNRWAMSLIPRGTLATVHILSFSVTPVKGKSVGRMLNSSLRVWLLFPDFEPPGL